MAWRIRTAKFFEAPSAMPLSVNASFPSPPESKMTALRALLRLDQIEAERHARAGVDHAPHEDCTGRGTSDPDGGCAETSGVDVSPVGRDSRAHVCRGCSRMPEVQRAVEAHRAREEAGEHRAVPSGHRRTELRARTLASTRPPVLAKHGPAPQRGVVRNCRRRVPGSRLVGDVCPRPEDRSRNARRCLGRTALSGEAQVQGQTLTLFLAAE